MANKNVDIKDWKANIISQLQNRNKHESLCFQDLIALRKSLLYHTVNNNIYMTFVCPNLYNFDITTITCTYFQHNLYYLH